MLWMWTLALAADSEIVLMGDRLAEANDLYRVLDSVLDAGVDRRVDAVVYPLVGEGRTLAQHAGWLGDKPDYIEAFGAARDLVLIQENPEVAFGGGDPAGATTLAQAGLRLGATTVLLQPIAPFEGLGGQGFVATQDAIDASTESYATALSALGEEVQVIPLGDAWRVFHEETADPTDPLGAFGRLYDRTGEAPSVEGTMLMASFISASLSGRFPVGGNAQLTDAELNKIQSVVEALVFADPFEAAHPWSMLWGDWVLLHGDTAISDPFLRPWVQVDGTASTETLSLGTTEDGVTGQGLLEVAGSFEVGSLRVGDTGSGDLLIRGTLMGGDVVVASEEGSRGRVVAEAATIQVERLLQGLGSAAVLLDEDTSLEVRQLLSAEVEVPGTFIAGPDLRVRGSLLTSGPVVLDASGVVQVDDRAVLTGSLEVVNLNGADEIELLRATRIDGAQLDADIEGYTLETLREEEGTQLMLLRKVEEGSDAVSPGAPAEGCGCAGGGGSAAWLLLLTPWLRRRQLAVSDAD